MDMKTYAAAAPRVDSSSSYSLADLEHYDSRAPSRGRERRFLCRECGDDKPRDAAHRSLCLNTQTGAYLCQRCGLKGKLSDYFEERPRLSGRELGRLRLAARFELRKPTPASEPRSERTGDTKADAWRAAWEAAEPIAGTPGGVYLAGRSIPVELAESAGVRFARDWYGRPAVLFPMRDMAGELVAVEGRHTDGREDPKTHSAGEKRRGVFSTPGAFEAPALTICEGPLDALALTAAGLPAIALCGKVAPAWLSKACALRPVILALDSDTAGNEAAATLKAELEPMGAHTLRLRPKDGKDWAEALEKRGANALGWLLRAFSASPLAVIPAEMAGGPSERLTADDVRICAARSLARAGRLEAALFAARMIDAGLTVRLAVERRLRQLADEIAVINVSDKP